MQIVLIDNSVLHVREYNGDKVILEPLENSSWPEGFWDAFPVDLDFKTPEVLLPLPKKTTG